MHRLIWAFIVVICHPFLMAKLILSLVSKVKGKIVFVLNSVYCRKTFLGCQDVISIFFLIPQSYLCISVPLCTKFVNLFISGLPHVHDKVMNDVFLKNKSWHFIHIIFFVTLWMIFPIPYFKYCLKDSLHSTGWMTNYQFSCDLDYFLFINKFCCFTVILICKLTMCDMLQ